MVNKIQKPRDVLELATFWGPHQSRKGPRSPGTAPWSRGLTLEQDRVLTETGFEEAWFDSSHLRAGLVEREWKDFRGSR